MRKWIDSFVVCRYALGRLVEVFELSWKMCYELALQASFIITHLIKFGIFINTCTVRF